MESFVWEEGLLRLDIDHQVPSYATKKTHEKAVRCLRDWQASFSSLFFIRKGNDDDESRGKHIIDGVKDFLSMMSTNPKKREHLDLFRYLNGTEYLVYLYNSPISNNKQIAQESIRLFLYPSIGSYPIYIQHRFCYIVFQFCKLLRPSPSPRPSPTTTTSCDDRLLYYSCRHTYESLLKSIGPQNMSRLFNYADPDSIIYFHYPFVNELTQQLLVHMKLVRQSCFCKVPSLLKSRFENDISEFSLLTLHMCTQIQSLLPYIRSKGFSIDSLVSVGCPYACIRSHCHYYFVKELKLYYQDFDTLLNTVDLGLTYMDDGVDYTRCTRCEFNHGWSYYLSILKELDIISRLYPPAQNKLSSCLNSHRVSLNKLVMRSKRGDDHQWLLRHKNLLTIQSRRHLVKMMMLVFHDRTMNSNQTHKTNVFTIDRSNLLVDSFQHVGLANPILLRNGIIPNLFFFKNEASVGGGPCVFKEWLLLLCQNLFTSQNSLFESSPIDRRRFFLNPAKPDPQQLQYYGFCGRLVALALMHNIQIGIGFDRLFFLQLTGRYTITLEDIRNVDPYMYKSCKDILEMDTEFIDSDCLGLTFVWETEEKEDDSGFGRKIVELCPGGNIRGVNSLNREEYIQLVIQHCFIKSFEEKVKLFIQGLDDVLTREWRKMFFQSIELEDLDRMLLLDRNTCENGREEEEEEENEVVDDDNRSIIPFEKMIRTTSPSLGLKSSHLPITCKLQSKRSVFR